MFSIRVAGNISGSKSLGSIEYAVAVAGVKLLLVLGAYSLWRCDFLGQIVGGQNGCDGGNWVQASAQNRG